MSGKGNDDTEPKAKRARYHDNLSDSDGDNLTPEDLEDIEREFGGEMVGKILKGNKHQDLCRNLCEGTWEDVEDKLLIFTSKGIMSRSKVCLIMLPNAHYQQHIYLRCFLLQCVTCSMVVPFKFASAVECEMPWFCLFPNPQHGLGLRVFMIILILTSLNLADI